MAVLGAAGGTGLAFAGSLPAPAQDAAHSVLSKVGLNVPRAHHSPDAHPANKGGEVSDVAHSTSPDDHGKGADVSDKASDGKSRAGEDHSGSGEVGGSGNEGDSSGKGKSGSDDGDHSTAPTDDSRREERRVGHGSRDADDDGSDGAENSN